MAIDIEEVTVLHEPVAHSGEEPGIEGYGFFVVTVLKGLVYLEFDGLQQPGDGAAIIVYVPWGEDSVHFFFSTFVLTRKQDDLSFRP